MRKSAVVIAAALLLVPVAAQALSVTFNPGDYGSYRADNSVGRYGTFSLEKVGVGGWVFNDQNKNNNMTHSLGQGTYRIKARDANVLIGQFDIDASDTIANVSGQVAVSGSTISFVNQTIALNGPSTWRKMARIWNTSWNEFDLTRFVVPAGTWGGWYGNVGDSNSFSISVGTTGTVTVLSDSRAIGISGGAGQLNFPSNVRKITYATAGGTPPGANWASLDWATSNLPLGNTTSDIYLYPGKYSFLSGFPTGSGSYWTPALSGGNITVPSVLLSSWSSTFTYHSGSNNQDYTYTFSEIVAIPEPAAAAIVGLGLLGLAIRKR